MSVPAFTVHQRSDLAWIVMDTATGLSALPARFEVTGVNHTNARHLAAVLNFIANELVRPNEGFARPQ